MLPRHLRSSFKHHHRVSQELTKTLFNNGRALRKPGDEARVPRLIRNFSSLISNSFWRELNQLSRKGDGIQAEALVNELLKEYEQQQKEEQEEEEEEARQTLDNEIFSLVLETWKNSESPVAARRARKLLEQMSALADHGILTAQPSLEDYHTVLLCMKQSSEKQSLDSIQEILARLKDRVRNQQPTATTYELILSILANGGYVESALQLLDGISTSSDRTGLTPTVAMHNCILLAWANSSDELALQRADAYFRKMQAQEQGMPKPDGESYDIVIASLSSSGTKEGVDRAETILNSMKASKVNMTAKTYQYVVSALAKRGEAERAEKLLAKLIMDYNVQFDADLKPSIIPFQSVLRAYSRSYHPDAAARAESVLRYMRELYQSEMLDTQPNVWSYNICMLCWARSRSPNAGERAKLIYDEMRNHGVQADTTSINTVLNAYARSTLAVETEKLLWEFYDLYEQNPSTNPQPDVVSFSTVLKALAKSRNPKAPERAEALLSKMQELHQSGLELCKPDVVAYASVIECWGKSKRNDSPERAERLLRQMQEIARASDPDIEPDTVCWNSTINAWAEVGRGERAEALFDEMLTNYIEEKQSAAVPNAITFSAVLSAWAKTRSHSEAPTRAELILQRMKQLHQSGVLDVKPNVITYSIMLNCLAYAKRRSAAEKAESILREMRSSKDEDVHPNVVAYNSVIKAWSFVRDREAVRRVTALLEELLDQAKENPKMAPNANTFGSVLKTLADSRLPDKGKRAEAVVHLMQKFGVETTAWSRNQLKKCASNYRKTKNQTALDEVPELKYS